MLPPEGVPEVVHVGQEEGVTGRQPQLAVGQVKEVGGVPAGPNHVGVVAECAQCNTVLRRKLMSCSQSQALCQ